MTPERLGSGGGRVPLPAMQRLAAALRTRPAAAWVGVAALLALTALVGWTAPRDAIDWQPGLVWRQPWRAFSAVGVHYSVQHLIGNLAGAALAGVFGVVAQVPARLAAAWLAAWPLTHLALLALPELRHFGGLSGVLHAGVAIVAVWLLANGAATRAQRIAGAAVALGLAAKLLSESPWGPVLRHSAGWDIALAPIVHTTGALAGAACAIAALHWPGRRPVRP